MIVSDALSHQVDNAASYAVSHNLPPGPNSISSRPAMALQHTPYQGRNTDNLIPLIKMPQKESRGSCDQLPAGSRVYSHGSANPSKL